jgi:competence ComEA-like helix-hairpin-helix protein
MIPNPLTPAERRLAGLVFLLAALGALARAGRGVSPAVDAWLAEVADTAAVSGPDARAPDTLGAAAGAGPGAEARGAAPEPPPGASDRVDPNRAGYEVLLRLPGVGPVLARRILDDRVRNGPYRSVDDLRRVSGIGPRTLERLRPRLAVGGAPGG